MGIKICPTCGGKVSEHRNDCIHCGYVFPLTKICPDCGDEILLTLNECPSCGYVFNVEQEDNGVSLENEANVSPTDNEDIRQVDNETEDADISDNDISETLTEVVSEEVKPIVCPYCGGVEQMEIGINFYMCKTCKSKFINENDISLNYTKPIEVLTGKTEPKTNLIATQNEGNLQITEEYKNFLVEQKQKERVENEVKKPDDYTPRENEPHKRKFGWLIALSICIICTIACCLFIKPNTVTKYGVKYEKLSNGTYEVVYVNKNVSDVTIPEKIRGRKVTSIGENSFEYCKSLTSVKIGNNVTSIGRYAFGDCKSLTSITIGNGVTSIGGGAFYDCTSLTSITIPNSVTSIGGSAFSGCSSLTSIKIPNGVKSIGRYAFGDCSSLTNITIPNSVTSIGEWAFDDCTSLTCITFNGTKSQWLAISKDYNWKYNVPTTCKVKCTDGTVSI